MSPPVVVAKILREVVRSSFFFRFFIFSRDDEAADFVLLTARQNRMKNSAYAKNKFSFTAIEMSLNRRKNGEAITKAEGNGNDTLKFAYFARRPPQILRILIHG